MEDSTGGIPARLQDKSNSNIPCDFDRDSFGSDDPPRYPGRQTMENIELREHVDDLHPANPTSGDGTRCQNAVITDQAHRRHDVNIIRLVTDPVSELLSDAFRLGTDRTGDAFRLVTDRTGDAFRLVTRSKLC